MITIFLNGEKREVEGQVNLDRLLDLFSLPKQLVAIELNRTVVRRKDWEVTTINDADNLEVIHFVGGG